MITKYGYSTAASLLAVIFVIIIISVLITNGLIKFVYVGIGAVLTGFVLYFFRDPERNIPEENNIILSPADGKIIDIKQVSNDFISRDDCIQVSIFLSLFDVHVNRIPCSGKIIYVNRIEGNFNAAFMKNSDKENFRTEIGIESSDGKIHFTQVSGLVARRIVTKIQPGDIVVKGERFGMIKFGSRSDVIVDNSWQTSVKIGDKVRAGESVLFKKTYG